MELVWALENLTPTAILDILLVALVFFSASFFFRGTQAVALLRGMLVVLLTLLLVSSLFNLQAVRWLLENTLLLLGIAIPVIFQPELRRALEQLGRAGLLLNRPTPESQRTQALDEVCRAAEKLSERRHGALIVMQRGSSLQEYIRTGIPLNSEVTAQLLLTVFWPKTELHDGAAIIGADGRLASAASVLPLSASRNLPDPKLGTRHRAALGLSEVSDAVVIIVSEETGRVSIAHGGRLIPRLDSIRLRTVLDALYGPDSRAARSPAGRVRDEVQRFVTALRDRRRRV